MNKDGAVVTETSSHTNPLGPNLQDATLSGELVVHVTTPSLSVQRGVDDGLAGLIPVGVGGRPVVGRDTTPCCGGDHDWETWIADRLSGGICLSTSKLSGGRLSGGEGDGVPNIVGADRLSGGEGDGSIGWDIICGTVI